MVYCPIFSHLLFAIPFSLSLPCKNLHHSCGQVLHRHLQFHQTCMHTIYVAAMSYSFYHSVQSTKLYNAAVQQLSTPMLPMQAFGVHMLLCNISISLFSNTCWCPTTVIHLICLPIHFNVIIHDALAQTTSNLRTSNQVVRYCFLQLKCKCLCMQVV